MSLSSDAAASLSAALTRAASRTGSLVPSNQILASCLPPCSFARSRRMRAESISEPGAALANVLARIIFACSIAFGGRSRYLTLLRNRASASALFGGVAPAPPRPRWCAPAAGGIQAPMPNTAVVLKTPRNSERRPILLTVLDLSIGGRKFTAQSPRHRSRCKEPQPESNRPVYDSGMQERATTRGDYAMRLERVFRWLTDHMDDTLDLTRLAEVACMSPYHFHRIYHAMQGETAAETVRRLRLHRARGGADHGRTARAPHRPPRGLRKPGGVHARVQGRVRRPSGALSGVVRPHAWQQRNGGCDGDDSELSSLDTRDGGDCGRLSHIQGTTSEYPPPSGGWRRWREHSVCSVPARARSESTTTTRRQSPSRRYGPKPASRCRTAGCRAAISSAARFAQAAMQWCCTSVRTRSSAGHTPGCTAPGWPRVTKRRPTRPAWKST